MVVAPGNDAADTAAALVWFDTGSGFVSQPLPFIGSDTFRATFPAAACPSVIDYYFEFPLVSGSTALAPSSGAAAAYSAQAIERNIVFTDDLEATSGWTAGLAGDTATTGVWVLVDPIGTAAQPEDDHSAIGAQCWVTGQGTPGGSIGSNDVDGGSTTLLTPIIDMSALNDPTVSYYRWYSNDQGAAPNADVFVIEISNNGGSSWSLVESVGPDGSGTAGGWIQNVFRVSSVVTPTSQMRMRFIASDLGSGSIVEAAIDDFEVSDVNCGDGIGTLYCDAAVNSTGRDATIIGAGSAELALNDLTLTVIDLPFLSSGYFIVSRNQAFITK